MDETTERINSAMTDLDDGIKGYVKDMQDALDSILRAAADGQYTDIAELLDTIDGASADLADLTN